MYKKNLKRIGSQLALLALLVLPELARAQYFNYNKFGDVLAGFRKTGVNAGSVTNFPRMSSGTTINISNVTARTLTDTFTNYNNLQWSVFSAVDSSAPWVTSLGTFPFFTLWYTLPGTNMTMQTTPPTRESYDAQRAVEVEMTSVGVDAADFISPQLGATNADNNAFLVREPLTAIDTLEDFISDYNNPADGDFGAGQEPLPYDVENVTPSSFTAAQRSDFYQVCPYNYVDPITGSTSAEVPYFMGYFILNPNGTMRFTRAFGVTATATNGSAPLSVVFSTTATNTAAATNWVWNFGNGTSVTNTTGASVSVTYTDGGTYTVTLTLNGPNGPSVLTLPNYVVASSSVVPTPAFSSVVWSGGMIEISGTNGSASAEYRILSATNLISGTWTPVFTNNFQSSGGFAYTNSALTGGKAYFKLVSP
jgi:hypothetical protein